MAERRDLMVATYSLLCGTGAMETVAVCTGMACIPAPAGGAAAFFWQPLAASPTTTAQPILRMRFKTVVVTCPFFFPDPHNLAQLRSIG